MKTYKRKVKITHTENYIKCDKCGAEQLSFPDMLCEMKEINGKTYCKKCLKKYKL